MNLIYVEMLVTLSRSFIMTLWMFPCLFVLFLRYSKSTLCSVANGEVISKYTSAKRYWTIFHDPSSISLLMGLPLHLVNRKWAHLPPSSPMFPIFKTTSLQKPYFKFVPYKLHMLHVGIEHQYSWPHGRTADLPCGL